jgi:hypothetical protein
MLRKGNSGKAGLGFMCAIVRPSRPGTLSDCTLKKYYLPTDVLVCQLFLRTLFGIYTVIRC